MVATDGWAMLYRVRLFYKWLMRLAYSDVVFCGFCLAGYSSAIVWSHGRKRSNVLRVCTLWGAINEFFLHFLLLFTVLFLLYSDMVRRNVCLHIHLMVSLQPRIAVECPCFRLLWQVHKNKIILTQVAYWQMY